MIWTIRRTEKNHYQLEDERGIVADYDRTEMTHPDDWIDDVDESDRYKVSMGQWRYVDERDL